MRNYQEITEKLPRNYQEITKKLPRNYQEITKKLPRKHQKNKHQLRHAYDILRDSIETKNNSKTLRNKLST